MTLYTSANFPTKKALKEAVAAGRQVTVWNPGFGPPPAPDATVCVRGPQAPKPHKWYATVTMQGGIIVKVK